MAAGQRLGQNSQSKGQRRDGEIPRQPGRRGVDIPGVDEPGKASAGLRHLGDEPIHRVDGTPNGKCGKCGTLRCHIGPLVVVQSRVSGCRAERVSRPRSAWHCRDWRSAAVAGDASRHSAGDGYPRFRRWRLWRAVDPAGRQHQAGQKGKPGGCQGAKPERAWGHQSGFLLVVASIVWLKGIGRAEIKGPTARPERLVKVSDQLPASGAIA